MEAGPEKETEPGLPVLFRKAYRTERHRLKNYGRAPALFRGFLSGMTAAMPLSGS